MIQGEKRIVVPKFKEILSDLGVPITINGTQVRCQATWRNGENKTSVWITDERYHDFGTGKGGSILDLICKISGIDSDEFSFLTEMREANPGLSLIKKLEFPKIYNESCLAKLSQDFSYWESRGISRNTQRLFEVGYASEHKMAGRTVFPIRKDDGKLIGFAGRVIKDNPKYPKWILIGLKRFFTYSQQNCLDEILKKERIIIVESIGDLLSLYESGVKNVMASFGLKIHKELLKLIIKNKLSVTLSFNNDERKQGNNAAISNKKNLSSYISEERIDILLPELNDWNVELNKNGSGHIREIFNIND